MISSKRSKAMILNHIFHLFTVIRLARMTSKGVSITYIASI